MSRIISPLLAIAMLASCSDSPTSPNEVGQLSLGAGYDVFVTGETAFVSTNDGIAIIDVRDIGTPRLVSTIYDDVIGFHVERDTLFTYGSRLALYDIGNIDQPQLITEYRSERYISGARRSGTYVYLSYASGGISVIDVSDLNNPSSVATVHSVGQANDMFLLESIVFDVQSCLPWHIYI